MPGIAVDNTAVAAGQLTTGGDLGLDVGALANGIILVGTQHVEAHTMDTVVSDLDGGLTRIGPVSNLNAGQFHLNFWYVLAPSAGSHVLSITPNVNTVWKAAAISLSGVNQLTPFRDQGAGALHKGQSDVEPAQPSLSMVSSPTDLILQMAAGADVNNSVIFTLGEGQTEIFNTNIAVEGSFSAFMAYLLAGADPQVVSAAGLNAGKQWVHMALSLMAAEEEEEVLDGDGEGGGLMIPRTQMNLNNRVTVYSQLPRHLRRVA